MLNRARRVSPTLPGGFQVHRVRAIVGLFEAR